MAEPVAKHCDLGPMHGAASCYTNSDGVECCDFCGNPADAPAPSPCPGCAAKDEAMAEIDRIARDGGRSAISCLADIKAIAKPFIPPADPVAEALKAAIHAYWPEARWSDTGFTAALAELKSRLPLGGA